MPPSQIIHTHEHTHTMSHPDAFGRSTWVDHEHSHRHSNPHGPEKAHRPHKHTRVEKADLRRGQLGLPR